MTLSRRRPTRVVFAAALNEKAGRSALEARNSPAFGFLEVTEPNQIAAMSAIAMMQSARALMGLSKASSEDLLLLAGLLLCLLRFLSFLSHLPLRYPSGSMQVDIDMHEMKSTPKFHI